jgi:hypothetical protein
VRSTSRLLKRGVHIAAVEALPEMLDVTDRLLEELTDVLVVQVIHDPPAVAAADHQPEMSEHPELMRHRRVASACIVSATA